MEKQLLDYVEQESKRGVPEHLVKKALLDAGWSDSQVSEAFAAVQSKIIPPNPGSELSSKEETFFGGDSDLTEDPAKKSKKPIMVAVSVFAVLAVLLGGLILYYNFSSVPNNPPETVEVSENETNSEEAPATNDKITESSNPGQDDAGSILPPGANGNATSTSGIAADVAASEVSARDNQRIADMQALLKAQKAWYAAGDRYYTCGLAGGDCKGKLYGYPLQIGTKLEKTPQDPMAAKYGAKKLVCGKDYVYCGLNNAPYPQFFCYYAKLEAGGYYTASYEGNFKRSTLPKIFEECAAAN